MMARSLLLRWDKMADKTMPDEDDRRIEADSSTEPTETTGDASAPKAAESARNGAAPKSVEPAGDVTAAEVAALGGEASARKSVESAGDQPPDAADSTIAAPAPSTASPSDAVWPDFRALWERKRSAAGSRLITAVEIENFKGIGRPMRVDLRPVTLLFGNNSAGKSTVLHALCYAHEILSHGNVDAHTTELGGDRIDLGGFHSFVHAHDPARTVRLRFDLNLEGWNPPELAGRLTPSYSELEAKEAIDQLVLQVASGWVELQVERRDAQPLLVSYEVGVNETLVGCIRTRHQAGVVLEFNPAHPLLSNQQADAITHEAEPTDDASQANTSRDRAHTTYRSTNDVQRLSRVAVFGLTSALPRWSEPLLLNERELDATGSDEDASAVFRGQVSALFAGIGQSLRDDLARLRYIGPVRDLHPRTRIASPAPDPERQMAAVAADFIHGRAGASGSQSSRPASASWADGSAAWTRLHDAPGRGLIDGVNDWLAEKDRLDTGYALHARSLVTIQEEDAQLIPALREHHRLREQFGNAAEAVDLDQWARRQADQIVAGVKEEIDRATRTSREIREQFTGIAGADCFHEEVEEAGRGIEMVDRHLRHLRYLRETSTVDALAARIKAPDEDETRAPAAWGREDTLSLARIVARTDARRKHRDEIRKLKVRDNECRDELRKLEAKSNERRDEIRKYEAEYDDAMNRRRQRECQILRRLLKNLASIQENTTALVKNLAGVREAVRKQLDAYGNGVNTESIEARIDAAGIEELDAGVERAQKEYPRLAALVAKMQQRHFTRMEIDALAAALAAGPPQRELQLVAAKTGLPVRPADVGVGISQILPVVVAALDGDRPGITAIEQPELHLHPRIQVELGDLFAQQVDKGGAFLIETHSEHLLLRFMKRMRQTCDGALAEGAPKVRPEDIAVYFVEIDPKGDQTLIREMPLNERGDLVEAWPGGFFEEDLREIF